MQAVLKPAEARPNAARSPAPPAPLQIDEYWMCSYKDEVTQHHDAVIFVFNHWVATVVPYLNDGKILASSSSKHHVGYLQVRDPSASGSLAVS